jgi:predicted metalloprotease with PDZ domain
LLWVYEGLTEYLGEVLAARSRLWTEEQYRESIAGTAAMLDNRPGRTWRPLEDTARSVQLLRMLGPQWQNWRRGLDYYPEGALIWLDVDTIIRQQTKNQKSLNDFCRRFHGGESGPPKVLPYTFEDVVRALNDVAPYDWAKLLRERVSSTNSHAPLGGIDRGGWKLVYNDKPNMFTKEIEKLAKMADFSYSLGFNIREDGTLEDVIVGSPSYKAGLAANMKLVAVNGRKWTAEVLHAAVKSAQESRKGIELLVENGQYFKIYSVEYHDGERNPHLERAGDRPDILGDIIRPLTH